jgi:glycerol-3-phosphate dehydrogenase
MFAGRFAPYIGVLGVSAGGGLLLNSGLLGAGASASSSSPGDDDLLGPVPTRSQALARLRGSTKDKPFDVLIIGGGATGTGCAVDAATR